MTVDRKLGAKPPGITRSCVLRAGRTGAGNAREVGTLILNQLVKARRGFGRERAFFAALRPPTGLGVLNPTRR